MKTCISLQNGLSYLEQLFFIEYTGIKCKKTIYTVFFTHDLCFAQTCYAQKTVQEMRDIV